MNFKKFLISAAMVTAVAWGSAGAAQAQTTNPDRVVYFTFSQPVTIPGATLPAGRYRFQILQSFSDRGILRIDSPDGSKHFGTLLALPATRIDSAPSPELRFLETASGAPPAIGSYWITGTGAGWEFVYPKDQATKLAINTKGSLLAGNMSGNAEQMTASGVMRRSASGETAYAPSSTPTPVSGGVIRGSMDSSDNSVAASAAIDASRTPVASSTPSTPRAPIAVNDSASNSAQSDRNQMSGSSTRSNRTSLPATAGISPLAALAGILALATAFGLGVWRRRVA